MRNRSPSKNRNGWIDFIKLKINAMRWLLTGDIFDADEARRIGLVQDVVAPGEQRSAAVAIAETIAKRAPFGVSYLRAFPLSIRGSSGRA